MRSRSRKVCVILPSHWDASLGGSEMQAKMLVERLVAHGGYDVHYIARRISAGTIPQGYSLHQLKGRAISGSFILDTRPLLKLLSRLAPDAIYQRVACAYTGVAAWYAKRNRCHMAWHVSSDRDLMPLRFSGRPPNIVTRVNKLFINYGARNAGTIIVQNQQQAASLRERFGRDDGIHIPNFHRAPREPAARNASPCIICWIGSIKPLRRAEIFLRLAEDFRERPDVSFVMVGGQQMAADAWQRLTERMKRLPNLEYTGTLPLEQVESLLERAHVLVNTSTIEGFPNTFIQSWMRGAAVASLAVNPDGVFDGNRYGICADDDYERLRKSIWELIEQPAVRTAMAARSREFALATFSERNADRILALLDAP